MDVHVSVSERLPVGPCGEALCTRSAGGFVPKGKHLCGEHCQSSSWWPAGVVAPAHHLTSPPSLTRVVFTGGSSVLSGC